MSFSEQKTCVMPFYEGNFVVLNAGTDPDRIQAGESRDL